jgi:hypothetical protein
MLKMLFGDVATSASIGNRLLKMAAQEIVPSSNPIWRDGRVVEGAALEMLCRGNFTEGSNPSLSVLKFRWNQADRG